MTEIYFLTVLEPGSPWSVAWRVWSLPRPILPCRQQPSCCVLTRSFLFFDASLVSLPPLERTQPNWPHYTFIISLKVSLSKYSHRVYKPPIWPHLITCVKIIFQKMVPFYVNRGWDFNIWILWGHKHSDHSIVSFSEDKVLATCFLGAQGEEGWRSYHSVDIRSREPSVSGLAAPLGALCSLGLQPPIWSSLENNYPDLWEVGSCREVWSQEHF